MKSLERIKFIMGSAISDIIGKWENPISQIDDAIVDAKMGYAKVRKNGAAALVNEANAKRAWQNDVQKAESMYAVAERATEAGNESDALAALESHQKYLKSAEVNKSIYDATHAAAEKLRSSLKEYQDAIKDMEAKKAEIVAKQSAANALKEVNKLTDIPSVASESAFQRLQAKADAEYEQALAENQINKDAMSAGSTEDELMNKYNQSNDTQSVRAKYEELKKKLGK